MSKKKVLSQTQVMELLVAVQTHREALTRCASWPEVLGTLSQHSPAMPLNEDAVRRACAAAGLALVFARRKPKSSARQATDERDILARALRHLYVVLGEPLTHDLQRLYAQATEKQTPLAKESAP